jgi:hypothetical protein
LRPSELVSEASTPLVSPRCVWGPVRACRLDVDILTEQHYREDLVGAALKQVFAEGIAKREDLFIQTK